MPCDGRIALARSDGVEGVAGGGQAGDGPGEAPVFAIALLTASGMAAPDRAGRDRRRRRT